MMAQYDGSIRINTEILVKSAEKQLRALENNMEKTAEKAVVLRDKMKSLKNIKIPTDEYKEIQKQISNTEVKLSALRDRQEKFLETGGKVSSSTYKKMEYDADQLVNTLNQAKADMQELVDSGKAFTLGSSTEEYSKLGQQLKYAEAALETMNQQHAITQDRLEAALQKREAEKAKLDQISAEEQRLAELRENAVVSNQEVIDAIERRKELLQEIADLEKAGVTQGYQDYDDRIQELERIVQELRDYGNGADKANSQTKGLGESLRIAFSTMAKGLKDIPIAAFKASVKGLGNIITKSLVFPFKMFGIVGKKSISSITHLLKRSVSSMLSFGKSTKTSNNALQSGLKNILKYGLGIRSVYALFNKIRNGIKTGFTNLMGYSDDFANSIQSVKNSMKTLGNQIAAAFRPIVEMVIPWINSLINALSKAMTYAAQFIAALTGNSTFTRAKKIQDKYNQSLNGTAKAADKARGALAKFDDLDVLEKQDSEEASQTLPKDMFEEVPIESSMQNLLQALKDFVYGEDWDGLGSYVADKFSDGLKKLYDIINWDNIGPQITRFVKAFTEAFNGIVDGFDRDTLGRTIGAGINTVVNTLNLLIEGIDWENLGTKISTGFRGMLDEVEWANLGNLFGNKFMILWDMLFGFVDDMWRVDDFTGLTGWSELGIAIVETLNGMFENINLSEIGTTLGRALTGIFQAAIDFAKTFDWIGLGTNIYEGINSFFSNTDWATVGKGISDFVLGLLDTLIVAIEGTDWQEIGESIKTFIANIDWNGLAERLSEGIGAVLGGLASLLWGLIEDAWNSVVDWWKETAFEDGKFTMQGLLDGILEIFANIGDWIYKHIFQPFVNGFKKAFGIHSPSTIMEEQGEFIMKGLLNGISSLVDSVKDIWNGLKTSTVNIFNGIWTAIKGVINSILGGVEKMANGVVNAINAMIRALNSIHFDIPDWVPALGGKSFGFDIGEIPQVNIPRLATGAVIRGGNPFMAILGDQPAGKTNIEAPLATIEQAVENVMNRSGANMASSVGNISADMMLDGETFARLMVPYVLNELGRQGYDVDVLGVN